jgi:hypothetical protein
MNSCICTISLFLALPAIFMLATPVFRCEAPGEPPLFSDLPCPHGTRIELSAAPLIQSVGVEQSGFAPPEKATSLSTSGAKRKSVSARLTATSRAERCEAARTALRGVQMKRRKGYSIAEGAQLEAQLREHKDTIRSSCW